MRALCLALLLVVSPIAAVAAVDLQLVGRYAVPPPDGETFAAAVFDKGAAEIVAHDPESQRLFVVNGAFRTIDVIDVANPAAPALLFSIGIAASCPESVTCRAANSVGVYEGLLAVAVEADPKTDPGVVLFFDADGALLGSAIVGAQPDMVTFTPDGKYVLTANEAEPSAYGAGGVDPEGSVSVIRLLGSSGRSSVATAGFAGFNGGVPAGVRVFGPGSTPAQDLEPEYIAVSADSKTAYVTLQENKALAIVDIKSARVTAIRPLGLKDHAVAGNGLDPTNSGAVVAIGNWPVKGLYQPDAIALVEGAKKKGGFLAMVNEGDVREWPEFTTPCFGASSAESIEVKDAAYVLDPADFPNAATLKVAGNVGNLKVTRASGDLDGDCKFDEIHAFGARSLTLRALDGSILWDSGDLIEQLTAAVLPNVFNASNTNNTKDNRSDDKGPEPEALAIGKAYGKTLAFVGLERIGGVVVFDVTEPTAASILTYENDRDFTKAPDSGEAKDLGPEGIHFITAADSPTGVPLIVVANEVSGTTSIFAVVEADE